MHDDHVAFAGCVLQLGGGFQSRRQRIDGTLHGPDIPEEPGDPADESVGFRQFQPGGNFLRRDRQFPVGSRGEPAQVVQSPPEGPPSRIAERRAKEVVGSLNAVLFDVSQRVPIRECLEGLRELREPERLQFS